MNTDDPRQNQVADAADQNLSRKSKAVNSEESELRKLLHCSKNTAAKTKIAGLWIIGVEVEQVKAAGSVFYFRSSALLDFMGKPTICLSVYVYVY